MKRTVEIIEILALQIIWHNQGVNITVNGIISNYTLIIIIIFK
jgi:hypothetical protein